MLVSHRVAVHGARGVPTPQQWTFGVGLPERRWAQRDTTVRLCRSTLRARVTIRVGASVAAMGLYRDHVVPRLVDVACGTAGLARWRTRVCDGLAGRVVEIGFGAGRNVPFYPAEVTTVYAVEPSTASMKMAFKRNAASRVRIEHVGLDGGEIQLADGSCDAALMTFTLCTVSDPRQVLAEIRRVLVPGGQLHFLEHGIAPEPSIARWQVRLDPWERRLADGCHLTRDALELVTEAGFLIETVEQRYARGPKPWSYFTLGVATSP